MNIFIWEGLQDWYYIITCVEINDQCQEEDPVMSYAFKADSIESGNMNERCGNVW